jgi:glutathione S-transferase
VDATGISGSGPTVIFGANAICRYLAVKYSPPITAGALPFMGVSSVAVEDLLDAEEAKLEPAVEVLEAAVERFVSSGGSGALRLPLDAEGTLYYKCCSLSHS